MSIERSLAALILATVISGCAANMSVDNKVIAVVGDRNITYGQFKQQYSQNYFPGVDSNQSAENKEKFLNLLVDYNLKLLDAQKMHLQDDPAIKAETEGYKQQLAVSYVMENEITLPMVRKIYDRNKYEVRAMQVFIRFPADSAHPAGDTLKGYKQAMEVINALKAGASFDSLAKAYRGGDTYYITAGSFLKFAGGEEFEDMLYSLNPGEISPTPIRTPYGYLVLKLTEKRPRVESIRASHILVPVDGKTPDDTLKAYDKALAILDSIKQGVDFAKLAKDNSSDKYSAEKGGDLGFFSRGMMVRPFDEAAFSLQVGQVAGPVRSQFGYHIIKLTDIKPISPYDSLKEQIRKEYLDGGYKIDLAKFVDGLKRDLNLKRDDETIKFLYGKVDSTKQFSDTDFDSLLTPAERQRPLFTFTNGVGTIDTVISIAGSDESFKPRLMNWIDISTMVDNAAKQMLITSYSLGRINAYAGLDSLIKQYSDGILIYHVEQKEVWEKVATTDSALKPYYFDHVDKYYWPKRIDLSEIHVFTDSLATLLHDSLNNGVDFDSLASRYTKRAGMAEKHGHWGLFADSANALVSDAMKMKEGEFSEPIRFEGGFSIIKVNKFVPSQPKTFEEARAEVSSDFQDVQSKKIQNDWLERLKREFGVSIDDKTFHELLAQN